MNGRNEDDFPHRLGDKFLGRLPPAFHAARKIDIAHDHAAENSSVRVRVARQHGYANRRKAVAHRLVSRGFISETDYSGAHGQYWSLARDRARRAYRRRIS